MALHNKKKLLVVLGPTASGKTDLAIELADRFGGEVICADSRTIYRGMDIGTAKPARKQLASDGSAVLVHGIRHYGLDIIDPDAEFSVADFQGLANRWMDEIAKRGNLPIIAGGTGLYIQAVVDGYEIPRQSYESKLRQKFEKRDLATLIRYLGELDPEALQSVDLNNKRRVMRALEICITTNKPFSSQREKKAPDLDILQIGLDVPRDDLYARINQRVDDMLISGLLQEVEQLLVAYPAHIPALSGIGYQQLVQYLRGEIDLEQAVDLIKRDTRRYAKRQMTWFRRDDRIVWTDPQQAFRIVDKWLKNDG